ncbi:SPOR domain-containing protein [Sphingomonas endolithica]|uniref:SPOR domain-containing protein n=1 Tax=Sphingomonas endolithica TaxID=2972485 RepID=UPI0021AF7704|nr:SPOR domain-containing protein [Sphingomonas sp. ZFBP2030]
MPLRISPRAIGLAAVLAMAGPALADVKKGIDLWNGGEYRKAVDEWRPAATAGDPQAQFNLGQAYKLGRGVPVDMAMAESWYRKAALQGLPQGEANYGLALFDRGARLEALPWLEKAVARGEPRAQLVLGTMLFNGDSVAKDWRRAYALMLRAQAASVPSAAKVLAQMDQYIPEATRQQGMVLAREYEAQYRKPELPPELSGSGESVASTAPTIPAPVITAAPPPRPRTPVAATPAPASAPAPVRTPSPVATRTPTPRPAPVATGKWRVQLGAFGDPANARKLWGQVAAKFPGRQPFYVKSGAITRLLVGPYGSSAEANRACAVVKPCVPSGG